MFREAMQYGLADNMIQSIFWSDQQTALNTQEETISLQKVLHTLKRRENCLFHAVI